MHPKSCETCRHAIKKTHSLLWQGYLCKAGGMVQEPTLPQLWINWFGCFWYDLSPWAPVTGEKTVLNEKKQ